MSLSPNKQTSKHAKGHLVIILDFVSLAGVPAPQLCFMAQKQYSIYPKQSTESDFIQGKLNLPKIDPGLDLAYRLQFANSEEINPEKHVN